MFPCFHVSKTRFLHSSHLTTYYLCAPFFDTVSKSCSARMFSPSLGSIGSALLVGLGFYTSYWLWKEACRYEVYFETAYDLNCWLRQHKGIPPALKKQIPIVEEAMLEGRDGFMINLDSKPWITAMKKSSQWRCFLVGGLYGQIDVVSSPLF
jgi:hypothetical protein